MTNQGIPFDRSFLEAVPVWTVPALEPKEADARTALRCLDLTTLGATDDADTVEELCRRGADPLGAGIDDHVAAVCVYPELVQTARQALQGFSVKVATVAAAFPHGQSLLENRVAEVESVAELGADEIDVVIRRPLALAEDWESLFAEVSAFRKAAGSKHLKTILATGELGNPTRIAKTALVCLMAGADYVKTSTGKETVNATLEAGAAMAGAIRHYESKGFKAGLKAAGGIKTLDQALDWCALVRATLGDSALGPERFRIGASGLLSELIDALGGGD